MAVDQPRHRERHVERMADVVVERVAGEIARVAPFEQRMEVVEGALEGREIGAGVARGEQPQHRLAHLCRVLDVDAIGDVVLVEPVLHGASAAYPRPTCGPT